MVEKWYQLTSNEKGNELLIYGDITSYAWEEDDVTSFNLAKELNELNGPLTVRINSYGGEVAEGLAIYNLLQSYKDEVTTIVDGFACSIASVIFLAGTKRIMTNASLMMIHNAWTYAAGNADDLRKLAADLEKIQEPSVQIYVNTSNLDESTIRDMMDAETWINASEALEYGFATEVFEKHAAKQSLEQQYLAKTIQKMKKLETELNKQPEPAQQNAWDAFFKKGK